MEGSTVSIDPSADRTADMEGDMQSRHKYIISCLDVLDPIYIFELGSFFE